MALNFSHRPIFPGHLSEDNLVDSIRISNGGYLVESIPENNVDAFGEPWHLNREVGDFFDYGRETHDRNGSQESVSKDIIDLLPSDPFGMDISSTFTAISGWLEDLEADYSRHRINEVGVSSGDYQLFAGLNFIWNNAMRFQAFQGNRALNCKNNAASWYGGCSGEKGARNVSCSIGFGSSYNMEGVASGYSLEKGVGDISCPSGLGSACNMKGISSGYSSVEKEVADVSCPIGFESVCNMEGVTSGYPSEEKGVMDVCCPIGFGSACNMEGITSGYLSEEKGVGEVTSTVGFGATFSGYRSEEKGVLDVPGSVGFGEACNGSCPVGFGSACSIEEITCVYGGCPEEKKGVRDVSCPDVLGSADIMENISSGCSVEKGVEDCSVCYIEDILSCSQEISDTVVGYQTEEWQKDCIGSYDSSVEACLGEAPHLVLGLAIGYLGVRDLLSVESVCRYLRTTVKSEPYLWTKIRIEQPLSEKITDELLLQLTNRAQGELRSLSLVECPRITDDGLMRVIESNPKLTKLSVPGCPKLSMEGIINNLKALKSMGAAGIKHLRIGATFGAEDHYEELKPLLQIDSKWQHNAHKPRFFHIRHIYLLCEEDEEDDRPLDVEMCPRCDKVRLIYDCTAEACQRKGQSSNSHQICRACTLCIERCYKCGRCINDGEYEETFCLDCLCSVCKRQEELAKLEEVASSNATLQR